jgi:hypothetical protein
MIDGIHFGGQVLVMKPLGVPSVQNCTVATI